MNEYEELESQLRHLRPAPIPDDLKAQLEEEPALPESASANRFLLWAMAAAITAIGCATFINSRDSPTGITNTADAAPRSVNHLQKNSTLLGLRTVAFEEHDGQVWEVAEQEWLDETIAICSSSPTELRASVVRREIVYSPIEFQ